MSQIKNFHKTLVTEKNNREKRTWTPRRHRLAYLKLSTLVGACVKCLTNLQEILEINFVSHAMPFLPTSAISPSPQPPHSKHLSPTYRRRRPSRPASINFHPLRPALLGLRRLLHKVGMMMQQALSKAALQPIRRNNTSTAHQNSQPVENASQARKSPWHAKVEQWTSITL